MSQTKLTVEVMDGSGVWNDITSDVEHISVDSGLTSARGYHSRIGRCILTLKNTSNTYNPDISAYVSALLENRRRVRVHASGATLGNALQMIQTRINTSVDQAGFVIPGSTTTINPGDVLTLTYQARAQFDSQWNVDRVILNSNAEGYAYLPTYTNKWKTYTFSFTATLAGTSVSGRMDNIFPVSSGLNSRSIEYKNFTVTKNGGANLLTNGNFTNGLTGWTPYNNVGTCTIAAINDYWTIFQGVIEDISPAPFVRAGKLNCTVLCLDWTEILRLKMLDLPLQKSQRGDQLNSTALATLPSGTLNTTIPGILQDAGIQTFTEAWDTYTKNVISVLDATADSALSEYSMQWIDRDGTFRWSARDFIAKRINNAPALSLSDGIPFDMQPVRSLNTVTNKVNLTYHPRQRGSSSIALGTIVAPITIPPVGTGGVAGSSAVTLTFVDSATSRLIGGDNVATPLVANTDYKINDRSDGTGVDYTTSSLVTVTVTQVAASQITIMLQSTHSQPLYATLLQCRGIPIYTFNPVTITSTDSTSSNTYQERTLDKDLPFVDDPQFTTSLANYLIQRFKTPFVEVQQVTVTHKAQLNNVDLLGLELMDIISISDTQIGMSNLKHMIVGVNYDLTPESGDYLGACIFQLERIDQSQYWILQDAIYGVLGSTTMLYI